MYIIKLKYSHLRVLFFFNLSEQKAGMHKEKGLLLRKTRKHSAIPLCKQSMIMLITLQLLGET